MSTIPIFCQVEHRLDFSGLGQLWRGEEMKWRPLFHTVQTAVLFFYFQCCYIGFSVSTGRKNSGLASHFVKLSSGRYEITLDLWRNLYAGQEATVRTGHGTTDWFQIGKGVHQGCILSPCLFNLYAENIMRNAGLEETQAGIKMAGRNINNLRYGDDTTLMAESEEELKSLLMKVKVESEKVGLKLNIQKMKIMTSGPTTSWEIDGETVETVSDFILEGSKITADGDCSHEIRRRLLLGIKVMTNLDSIFKSRDICQQRFI